MREYILTIDKRGRWAVIDRPNVEPRPRLLRARVEHAVAVFMAGEDARPFWRRYRGPVGRFWVGLDEGNLHIGASLSPVEQLITIGVVV